MMVETPAMSKPARTAELRAELAEAYRHWCRAPTVDAWERYARLLHDADITENWGEHARLRIRRAISRRPGPVKV
jgi:hypothetical protein